MDAGDKQEKYDYLVSHADARLLRAVDVDFMKEMNYDEILAAIDAGANPNISFMAGLSLLYLTVGKAPPQFIRDLLARGANPNIVMPAVTEEEYEWTPLAKAIDQGRFDNADALLDGGADIRLGGKAMYTALMCDLYRSRTDYTAYVSSRGGRATDVFYEGKDFRALVAEFEPRCAPGSPRAEEHARTVTALNALADAHEALRIAGEKTSVLRASAKKRGRNFRF